MGFLQRLMDIRDALQEILVLAPQVQTALTDLDTFLQGL